MNMLISNFIIASRAYSQQPRRLLPRRSLSSLLSLCRRRLPGPIPRLPGRFPWPPWVLPRCHLLRRLLLIWRRPLLCSPQTRPRHMRHLPTRLRRMRHRRTRPRRLRRTRLLHMSATRLRTTPMVRRCPTTLHRRRRPTVLHRHPPLD